MDIDTTELWAMITVRYSSITVPKSRDANLRTVKKRELGLQNTGGNGMILDHFKGGEYNQKSDEIRKQTLSIA